MDILHLQVLSVSYSKSPVPELVLQQRNMKPV